MPEAAINLAQAATYLALAPKSNASYMGLNRAREEVKQNGPELPPEHLRDSHYSGAAKLGRGAGYRYPHDQAGGVTDQPMMPVMTMSPSAAKARVARLIHREMKAMTARITPSPGSAQRALAGCQT
jgi:replication-associated recombination protein RarA